MGFCVNTAYRRKFALIASGSGCKLADDPSFLANVEEAFQAHTDLASVQKNTYQRMLRLLNKVRTTICYRSTPDHWCGTVFAAGFNTC